MKRIWILFLSLLLPINLWASDHCTDPDKYTVDRRCYVTDEQKAVTPYNSIVALGGVLNKNYCTGTIAQWNRGLLNGEFSELDNLLYVFTAKHCADTDEDGRPDDVLTVKTQTGERYEVALVAAGNYDIDNDVNWSGDWAVYGLPISLVKDRYGQDHVNIVSLENLKDKLGWVYADADEQQGGLDVILVGYGSLKIMSDQELSEFKERYIEYLAEEGITITDKNARDFGLLNDGVNVSNSNVIKYLDRLKMFFYRSDIFKDHDLKVSKCKSGKSLPGCQGWGGNSGGPIFDSQDHLIGVLSRGGAIIGGVNHARSVKDVTTGDIYKQFGQSKL